MRYAAGLARGNACGCVPLIGAPSDRSGGATITLALDGLQAEVTAEPALGVELITPDSPSGPSAANQTTPRSLGAMEAAAKQILAGREDLADAGFRLELGRCEIPPGVELGESTAITLAALEALNGLFGIGLAREQLPPLALACLIDRLGVPGTLRDPVAQSEGGLTFMDFDAEGSGGGRYEPLDPALLPPLFVAWPAEVDPAPADNPPSPSVDKPDIVAGLSTLGGGAAGENLEPDALAELGGLAQRALSPLLVRDGAGFGVLLERDRELRETVEPPNPLAEAAARLGVAVNSTSPTGAIVGLFGNAAQLGQIREALTALGAELLIVRPD